MRDWTDIHTKEQLKKRYLSYVPFLMKLAQKHGYALALHGSCERDLDLLAAPWVPKAMSPESLAMSIEESFCGRLTTRKQFKAEAKRDPKPFGRKAWSIVIANLADDFDGVNGGREQRHAYIDLSVMPRRV